MWKTRSRKFPLEKSTEDFISLVWGKDIKVSEVYLNRSSFSSFRSDDLVCMFFWAEAVIFCCLSRTYCCRALLTSRTCCAKKIRNGNRRVRILPNIPMNVSLFFTFHIISTYVYTRLQLFWTWCSVLCPVMVRLQLCLAQNRRGLHTQAVGGCNIRSSMEKTSISKAEGLATNRNKS